VHEVIDNQVVMLNVDLTKGNSSIIKFGGYDTDTKYGFGFNIFNTDKSLPVQYGSKYGYNIPVSGMIFLETRI